MRILSIILAFFIFNSSVNITELAATLSMADYELSHSCCNVKSQDQSTSVDEDACDLEYKDMKKVCCDDGVCDCQCCHAVSIVGNAMDLKYMYSEFLESIPYAFNYYHDFSSTLDMPPILS